MREIAAVAIVFGLIGFAMTANISPYWLLLGVLVSGAIGIGVWAYVAWGGRDPFGPRPRRSVAVDIALTLNGLLPEGHPMRAVYKSIARHARRAGFGAPRSPWRRVRGWLAVRLSPEAKARLRRVLARIPGGAG